MKFFFCEGCGKRITDAEIERGDGKDKKLKGVYCKACAVGVLTMETLPLTDDQAKDILGQPSPPTKPALMAASSKGFARRGSSAIRLPLGEPGAKRKVQRDSSHSYQPQTQTRKRNSPASWILPLGFGVAAFIIGVVFLAVNSGKQSASGRKVAPRVHQNARPRQPLSTQSTVGKDADQPSPSPWSDASRPLSTRDGELGSNVVEERSEIEEENAGSSGALEAEAPAEVDPEKVGKNSTPSSETKEPGPSNSLPEDKSDVALRLPEPARALAGAATVAAPKPDRSAFDQHFDALVSRVRTSDFDAALAQSRKMAADEKLADWQASMLGLPKALSFLVLAQKERLQSVKKLKGKTVSLDTIKGLRKGFIKDVDGEKITVQARFQINGAWKVGQVRVVPLSELTAGAWSRIHPEREPAQPPEWVARFLSKIALNAFDEAAKSLAGFEGHPLHAAMKHALDRRLRQRRERQAREAWVAILKRDVEKVSDKDAREVLAQVDAYESEYKGTAWWAESESQRTALREKMAVIAMAFEKNLKRLLHGVAKVEDARRMRVSLDYDFKHKAQVKDWGVGKAGAWEDKGTVKRGSDGGIYLSPGGGNAGCLVMKAFEMEDLSVKLDYTIKSFGNHGAVLLRIGREATTEDAGIFIVQMKPDWQKTSVGHLEIKADLQKGKAPETERKPHAIPAQGSIEIVVKDGRIKVVLADGFTMERNLPKAPLLPLIGIGGGTHIMYNVNRVQVTGNLDRTWFKSGVDEHVRKSKLESE